MASYAGISFLFGIVIIKKGESSVLAYKSRNKGIIIHRLPKVGNLNDHSLSNKIRSFAGQMKLVFLSNAIYINEDFNKAEKIVTAIIALIFIAIFTFLPYLFSEITYDNSSSSLPAELLYNSIKSTVKLALLLALIYIELRLLSTLFKNHSAEHKLINCLESGKEINYENVKKASHINPRCGMVLLLLGTIVSIFYFGITDGIIKTYLVNYVFIERFFIHLLQLPILTTILLFLHKYYLKLITSNKYLSFFINIQKLTLIEAEEENINLALKAYQNL